jgi:hypothetical protein
MPVPEKSVPKPQNLKITESFGVKKTCLATIGGRIKRPAGSMAELQDVLEIAICSEITQSISGPDCHER